MAGDAVCAASPFWIGEVRFMMMQVYESDEFVGGPESSQRLLYFESRKAERQYCDTYEDFIKLCMIYEARYDNAYNPKRPTISMIQNQVNEDFANQVIPIPNDNFLANKFLSPGLPIEKGWFLNCKFEIPSAIIRCMAVYEQAWNYLFHVAESDDCYYGYVWLTGA